VGRLDRDSTGLLLLTNDGRLHHRLSHPSFDHEKEYRVETRERMPDNALRTAGRGGFAARAGKRVRQHVERVTGTVFRIVLKEGRNRQIRHMVTKVGGKVRSLHRIRIANIHLGRLPEGKWRRLGKKEEKALYARAGIKSLTR
jgi:23S rRNA pseudouridine2605 synthase